VSNNTEANESKIRTFISRFIRVLDLKDEEEIFALGFVKSLFAIQLVMFVEKEFGVVVDNDDIDIENFKSVNAIAALVERKTAPATSA
jgi:methoxymalonate biosynthesis acyl carrier protein